MIHLDAEAVHRGLDWKGVVAALRRAHQGEKPFSSTNYFDAPDGVGDKFVNLTSWAAGDVIAVKLVGVFPGNVALAQPQPSVQGVVALFDGKTGEALMTCDGAALTYRKTAADSALGADLLARPDAEVLAIAGAGGLAPYVAEAHCAIRPIRRILIWNRSRNKAEDMALALAKPGREIEVVDDFAQALPQADIVSAVTMSRDPVIQGALLKPGAHVDLVGAYLPDMREADAETLRRAGRMFADTRFGFTASGDATGPIAEGLIEGPEADYFDLCAGRHPGRRSAQEITVCKNVGGGHLDLFVTRHLWQVAGR